jgi:hypothetical protein
MPPLKTADGIAKSTDEKVQALREAFFPAPPTADLSDITGRERENQINFPPTTRQELADAIRRAPPNKAPGADGIPNRIWRLLASESSASYQVFISSILDIFNVYLRISHNP